MNSSVYFQIVSEALGGRGSVIVAVTINMIAAPPDCCTNHSTTRVTGETCMSGQTLTL